MRKTGKKITAFSVSFLLMLNLTATVIPVSAESGSKVYTHDGYTVEYTIKNEWTGNQNIEVTITNTSDDVLSGWAMGYNAFGEIGGLWNAKIYGHQGTEYIFSSAGYNDELAPGQSTNFGYTLTGDSFKIPQDIVNCAKRVDIAEGYNVYYNVTADFVDTYQAEMIIENTSDTDITAWQLSFDGNVSIDNLWNGKLLENNNGSFKVKNAENNSVIAAGSSVSFNFGGTKNTETEPDPGYSEPAETTSPVTVVTDEFSETETSAESAETDAANPETDPTETETSTVSDVMPVSEVVFSNYKLTGVVIPMEFDFEIDPEMDSDEDGLPDYIEKEIGSDRYNADTDGDGLPDGYEYFTLGTDPKKADSDDNGISDADEDFDEDRLTNLEEYELGTDPFSKDTDYDGLSDYDEVKIHNTDPLKYDTDGDKVSDGDEIELGLDPNNPATNGYPDNEYTTKQTVGEDSSALDYINTIEDNPYTVSVEITAAGVAENNLSAGESGYSYSILQNDAVLGVVPELSYSDGLSVTDVVIKFKLDTNAAETSIDKLMVFKYFEDTNMLLPIETTYDASTNVISTHVDEVGTYCLINVEKWLGILEETPAGNYYEDGENEPANIVFCLDTRSVIDAESFNAVKNDIKTITENAFDRYSDIKVYVYYQQFGSNFKAANKLLTDSNGNNYFTGYEEAVAALDKLETYMIKNNYWAYDFVEATQFMIDNCDEKIIAMYHITADDRVMGGMNKAKKLTQTVRNSKYTTADGEKIQRIYVSTLCPNDTEPFDTSSYAYELATLSKGIAVTGYDMVNEIEIQSFNVEVNNAKSNYTSSKNKVTSNLRQILGDGNEGVYKIISSAGLTTIKLNQPLTDGSDEDYDNDGLSDWDEVNTNLIYNMYAKNNNSCTAVIKSSYLPTLADCRDYYTDISNQKVYVEKGYEIFINKNAGMYYQGDKEKAYAELSKLKILPIYSDPTKADSDGDGFFDGITGKYQPTGYYKVADKWPLSSKPHPAFYQKDGEYYFNSFSFPDTNVGGRFYGAKGLNLEEDDQKYIYTLCEVANKNLKKDVIDPLLIMSICAHETGSQADAINKNSKTTGYMQLFPFYVIDYCESDLTDGEPYYTIYGFYEYVKLITSKEKWSGITEDSYKHYNNYRSNGEIGIVTKAIINYAINNGVIKEHQYDILKHYQSSLDDVQKVLTDGKINITFGITFLSAFNTYKTTDYDALKSYCGDSKSPREDIFYRNTLATLIEEDVIYEKEYVNEVNYGININSAFVELSKS